MLKRIRTRVQRDRTTQPSAPSPEAPSEPPAVNTPDPLAALAAVEALAAGAVPTGKRTTISISPQTYDVLSEMTSTTGKSTSTTIRDALFWYWGQINNGHDPQPLHLDQPVRTGARGAMTTWPRQITIRLSDQAAEALHNTQQTLTNRYGQPTAQADAARHAIHAYLRHRLIEGTPQPIP